jgi:dihydroorotate dehydrogenase (NAD+) catalytic subunit
MSSVKFGNVKFSSPILVASGTYGYGHETASMIDVNGIGGIVTKSVTRHPREGNPPPRIAETSSGMLNSIGLANVGVEEYCKSKLPYLNELNTKIIINIAGTAVEDYVETLQILEAAGGKHVGYEINISCPNVKEGGMSFGVSAQMTESLTTELRKCTSKLLIMKLSPNVTSIEDIALGAENGGADGVSAINTLVGMGIDIKTRKMKINTTLGGLSGPAIKPVALANVHKVFKAVKIPIIGLGGISCVEDVIEFILAGADLVQIGTLNYREPGISIRLAQELDKYCKDHNLSSIHDLKGLVEHH